MTTVADKGQEWYKRGVVMVSQSFPVYMFVSPLSRSLKIVYFCFCLFC